MAKFIINSLIILIAIIAAVFIYFKFHPTAFDDALARRAQKERASFVKNDADRLGKRMKITRKNGDPAEINFYQKSGKDHQPAVFVLHGGGFMAGDADQADSWCDRMGQSWHKTIISLNYKTIDQKGIPYQQEEIRDTVIYFARKASLYHLDPGKFVLLGFSAGAYFGVGAGALLRQYGFNVKGLIMIEPFIDDTLIRLADSGLHVSPVSIITAGSPRDDRVAVYESHLAKAGVDYVIKNYRDAVTGFIEYNNPEFADNPRYAACGAFTDEQKDMARSCEMWIGNQIDGYINET